MNFVAFNPSANFTPSANTSQDTKAHSETNMDKFPSTLQF